MKQEIPCKGVEKNEEVIFKYSTNFYRQFNNKQFISYWIFLFKCCTQLPCLATCLGYLSDKEQQTVADDTPLAQLLQQMLHETRKNEKGRQRRNEEAKVKCDTYKLASGPPSIIMRSRAHSSHRRARDAAWRQSHNPQQPQMMLVLVSGAHPIMSS